ACGAEHLDPVECHRSTHHAPRRLRGEPREAQADRRDLRLAEDHRADATNAAPRPPTGRLDVRLQLGRVQPGATPKPRGAGRLMRSPRGGNWLNPATAARGHQSLPTGYVAASWPPNRSPSHAFSAAC